mgnify:CR=1 FL=1
MALFLRYGYICIPYRLRNHLILEIAYVQKIDFIHPFLPRGFENRKRATDRRANGRAVKAQKQSVC